MKKNIKFCLVIDPPRDEHGITAENHDFVTIEVGSESLECLAWFMSVVQDRVVSETQVEEDEPSLAGR